MNWTINKTEGQYLIKIVAEGDFNLSDHLKMIEDIVTRDFWTPGTNILVDYRNVDMGLTDLSTVRQIVSNYQKYDRQLRKCKIAKLMKSMADFGRGRQVELLGQDNLSIKSNTFLDEKEAINWLNSPSKS